MNNRFRVDVFAERLKKAREGAGLTKKALSEKAGVSVVSLVDYESRSKTPNLTSVCAIANALDISVDWLCGFQYPEDGPTGTGPNYKTARVLFNVIKLIDNSFTDEFFDHMDNNIVNNTPMYDFFHEYCQMKNSFREEAYESEYFKYTTGFLVGSYKKYSVDELFAVKANDNSPSEE